MSLHPLRVSDKYEKEFQYLYDYLHTSGDSNATRAKKRTDQCTLRNVASMIQMGMNCITLRDTGDIYFYNEEKEIWEIKAETYISQIIHSLCQEFTKYNISEILDKIKRETYRKREIFNPPNLIGVSNGVFDFEKFEFRESSPNDYLTRKLEIKYDPKATPTLFIKFLQEIIKPKDVETIEDAIGYLLSPTYKFHLFFVCIGEGSNGKSTLFNVLTAFLGENNVTHISMQDFDKNQYAASELFGKMANIADDLSDKALYHTGMLKLLTGGFPVTVNVKHKEAITFLNVAKMFFSCNKAPAIEFDDTKSIWRRLVPIEFPNVFMEDDIDPDLLKKLTTSKELSGILNLALFSLNRLMMRGGFKIRSTLKDRRKLYILKSNSIHAFAELGIEYNNLGKITNKKMMRAYLNFCTEHELIPETQQKLSKNINRYKTRMIRKEGKTRGWRGVRIKKRYLPIDDTNDTNDANSSYAVQLEKSQLEYIGPKGVIPVIAATNIQNKMSFFIDTALDNCNGNNLEIKKVLDLGELLGIEKNGFNNFIDKEVRGGKYFEPKPGFIRKP